MMLAKVAVDVKDVKLTMDVTIIDTLLSAMVELDVTWTVPMYINTYVCTYNYLLLAI